MSQSRPAREPPAKRPPLVDPRPRTIGNIVGSDSFGTNEEIWFLLVRVGLIPALPQCKNCHRVLKTDDARKNLHFSLMCRKCEEATNVIKETPLFQVKFIRKFLEALQGWCNKDNVCSFVGTKKIAKNTWTKYRTVIENVVHNTLRRQGRTTS